ncbi:MAG: FAD-dependent oxidoreductase [Planctomycetota bacterium]|jgi:sulfite reductase beta subunit-like hemoprotein/NADPH-dependent glutamate synthase beta subunit-like oxidoreductase/ferredoxin
MQRRITNLRRSDDEVVKEGGLLLDFDEIARHGRMTLEESKVAKAYGVYTTRHPNYFMARVVVPGGVLTTSQVRGLSKIIQAYAQGRICLTTRQALQLHYLRLGDLAPMMRELAKYSLTTHHGCGDNLRNTAACPWASVCPHRRFDVLPYARKTAELINASRDLDNLPRKYKVTYSGCEGNCGQPLINCVGIVAVVRKRRDGSHQTGFRVYIGGGMGWRPSSGTLLFGFVPRDRIQPLCRAVTLLYRDHGDRFDRSMARLKVVVERLGIDRCREIVEAFMDAEGVDHADFDKDLVEDSGPPIPARPLAEPRPRGDDGKAIARIMVPKGEIDFHSLKRVAELSERYGDKYVGVTNRQNFEIHGVDPAKLAELEAEIAKLPVRSGAFFGLDDVVPCVGTTYCPLAVSQTRRMYDMLESVVQREKYDAVRRGAIINVTGCPNACSPYYIADVGLRGMRIREGQGSAEGYEIRLGGTEEHFGRALGEFKTEDCPRVVEAVLDAYAACRQGEETLADTVWKHGVTGNPEVPGMAPYRKAIQALGIEYDHAPKPAELSVFTGEGRAALDLKTMARDVPCQAACPAGTNVPEYIRQLVLKNPDASYRINQEDNVFPGVLGRICTRPCEPACRHQWTNTNGPVTICHLKRAAADNKSQPTSPLPPWFDKPTGKHVAVVGGGPAGLAAARELVRLGHAVELFEREKVLGGQMAWGIPEFRLPRDVVQEEVRAIVDGGVEVHLGEHVDRDRLAQMAAEFDAVLVAAGAIRGIRLAIEGLDDAAGTVSGYDFMRRYNMGDPIPVRGDVVVIGGGFTAVDCSRVARRLLGAEHRVTAIMYRRGEEHMSASPDEIWQLRLEGIDVGTLVNPGRVRCENGQVKAVIFDRNVLGDEPEDGGKPPIYRVPDSEYEVPCDTLIYAVGQTRTLEILPEGVELTEANRTTHERIFVSGDFHTGPLDVIHAVADAKKAAAAIDESLMGRKRLGRWVRIEEANDTGRLRDHDLYAPAHTRTLPLEQREGNEEVELSYNAEEIENNARRCYLCNYKFEIDQDKCIHCDWCIKASPRGCIHRLTRLFTDDDGAPTGHIKSATEPDATYIWIESDQCIRCGNCHRACPTYAIPIRKADVVCGPI